MNFNLNLYSLRHNRKQGLLWRNRPEVPRIKWIVKSLWLEIGNRSKLPCIEVKLPFLHISLEVFDVVSAPFLFIFVPDANFNWVIFCGENVRWQGHYTLNWISLNRRSWIRILNAGQSILLRLNLSAGPSVLLSWVLRICKESAVDDASNADVAWFFGVFFTRDVVKTGPNAPHDDVGTSIGSWHARLERLEFNFLKANNGLGLNVSPDSIVEVWGVLL